MDHAASHPEHSDVVVFPPVIPLAGFVLGLVIGRLVPVALPLPAVLRAIGGVVTAAGVAGFAWMVVTMKRARTPIHNAKTPTTLVETGPFRRSRNPMYLFGSTAYAGLALVLLEPWSLLLLPAVIAAIHHGVVRREEAFLARRFGARYAQYAARVPRWL